VQGQAFDAMNSYQWLCKTFFGSTACASINYDWGNIRIRPVSGKISFSRNFLPGLKQDMSFSFPETKKFLGISEVIVDEFIGSRTDCKFAFHEKEL